MARRRTRRRTRRRRRRRRPGMNPRPAKDVLERQMTERRKTRTVITVSRTIPFSLFVIYRVANPPGFEFLNEDQLGHFSVNINDVIQPWKDELALPEHGLFVMSAFQY